MGSGEVAAVVDGIIEPPCRDRQRMCVIARGEIGRERIEDWWWRQLAAVGPATNRLGDMRPNGRKFAVEHRQTEHVEDRRDECEQQKEE
jgi:hypothetical protein